MNEIHGGVTSLDDIRYDLDGTEKFAAQIARFSSDGPASRRTRDIQIKQSADRGGWLVARRPVAFQTRYRTLFWMEAQFDARHDYGYLIGPACQILELELRALVTEPARVLGEHLVAALSANPKERKQAAILEGWAAGNVPSTIGITSLVLLALRRALEQGDPSVQEFLTAHFHPGYKALLAGKGLGACLDQVRGQFRNPACHGTATFHVAAYEQFAQLTVANRRFSAWESEGPLPSEPPGNTGVLHHHLQTSRLLPRAAVDLVRDVWPVELLFDLAAPRQTSLTIHLEPQPAAGLRSLRDIRLTPGRLERPFRIGDAIRFAFLASQDCQVTLIDVGTSGTIAVVLPNAWRQEARITGGHLHYLPAIDCPEFEFTLSGPTGRERVFAIASLGNLPAPLCSRGQSPFRVLTPADIDALVDGFGKYDPATWAACACEFEVCG